MFLVLTVVFCNMSWADLYCFVLLIKLKAKSYLLYYFLWSFYHLYIVPLVFFMCNVTTPNTRYLLAVLRFRYLGQSLIFLSTKLSTNLGSMCVK